MTGAPYAAHDALSVVRFDDSGVAAVQLPRGTWRVDGQIITGGTQVCARDVGNITRVYVRGFTTHYQKGDDVLGVDEYRAREVELCAGVDEYGNWDTLENEFTYKSFVRDWIPITEDIVSESDPYPIAVTPTRLTTYTPYVTSLYASGAAEITNTLFVYQRHAALMSIASDTFSDLGMTCVPNCHPKQTSDKKVWGHPDHSGIRFAVAFGEYVFDDTFDTKRDPVRRGTMDQMLSAFEADKTAIQRIIRSKFASHFINPGMDQVQVSQTLADVKQIRSHVAAIESKVSTKQHRRLALDAIDKLMAVLDDVLENSIG